MSCPSKRCVVMIRTDIAFSSRRHFLYQVSKISRHYALNRDRLNPMARTNPQGFFMPASQSARPLVIASDHLAARFFATFSIRRSKPWFHLFPFGGGGGERGGGALFLEVSSTGHDVRDPWQPVVKRGGFVQLFFMAGTDTGARPRRAMIAIGAAPVDQHIAPTDQSSAPV